MPCTARKQRPGEVWSAASPGSWRDTYFSPVAETFIIITHGWLLSTSRLSPYPRARPCPPDGGGPVRAPVHGAGWQQIKTPAGRRGNRPPGKRGTPRRLACLQLSSSVSGLFPRSGTDGAGPPGAAGRLHRRAPAQAPADTGAETGWPDAAGDRSPYNLSSINNLLDYFSYKYYGRPPCPD